MQYDPLLYCKLVSDINVTPDQDYFIYTSSIKKYGLASMMKTKPYRITICGKYFYQSAVELRLFQ